MADLCCTCLGRKFVYSPGGRAPKLPCRCVKGAREPDPQETGADDDAALTDGEVTGIARRAKRRLDGCNFTPNGTMVLACRESSGGSVADCDDEEIACVVSDALTAYYSRPEPTLWRYEFGVPRHEDGFRDGTVVWHVAYSETPPPASARNVTAYAVVAHQGRK